MTAPVSWMSCLLVFLIKLAVSGCLLHDQWCIFALHCLLLLPHAYMHGMKIKMSQCLQAQIVLPTITSFTSFELVMFLVFQLMNKSFVILNLLSPRTLQYIVGCLTHVHNCRLVIIFWDFILLECPFFQEIQKHSHVRLYTRQKNAEVTITRIIS